MVIWILDCATTYCTKVTLSKESENELEEVYSDSVEEFLYAHQSELGINMNYSSWMTTNEENFDEKDF